MERRRLKSSTPPKGRATDAKRPDVGGGGGNQSPVDKENALFAAILKKAGGNMEEMQRIMEEDLEVLFEDPEIRAMLLGELNDSVEPAIEDPDLNDAGSEEGRGRDVEDGDEAEASDGNNTVHYEDNNGKEEEEEESDEEVEVESTGATTTKTTKTTPAAQGGLWGFFTDIRDTYYALFSPEVLVEEILEGVELDAERMYALKRRAALIKPRLSIRSKASALLAHANPNHNPGPDLDSNAIASS